MTRSFNNQSVPKVIMPRISLNALVLCWIGLFILMVRADIKSQKAVQQKVDSTLTDDAIQCECEFFIQSWKTSHMIRLPMNIQPVRANATQTTSSEMCVPLCQNQLPPVPDDDKNLKWARIFKAACRTLLVNEYTARHGKPMMDARTVGHFQSRSSAEPIRGCLQAYARSVATKIWVPMGVPYRKLLSCTHPRHRRSAEEARKLASSQSSLNSVDAQSVIDAATVNGFPVARPPSDTEKKPANTSPLRMMLKQLGPFGPIAESLVSMLEGGGFRELLTSFQMGSLVNRYERFANDYAEEFDAGHCFFEYLTYTVFNNRFSQKALGSNRAIEDDAVGMLLNVATNFLKYDNASEVLGSLLSMLPVKSRIREDSVGPAPQSAPDVKDVALSIARFYLRNYFSSLSGSTVRVDSEDPTNNPDSIADMIEQVSRPVFLSVFGVVPGVPASGKLDHLLLIASKEANKHTTESRNKLVSIEPVRSASLIAPIIKTGNPFFDFGNNIVSTFQRASDATHGLYCVKQYFVNKMWDGFRGSMRSMMRSIPSVGG